MERILGVKRYFIVLIWTLLCKDTLAAPIRSKYQRCPFNKTEWEDRADNYFCQGKDVYHCLLDQDKTSIRENCVERSLVLEGNCPFFTNEGYLHWDPCNNTGCPNSSFISDEVYQYQACFDYLIIQDDETDDRIIQDDINTRGNNKQSNEGLRESVIAGLVVAAVVLVVAALVAHFHFGVCRKEQDEWVPNGCNVLRNSNSVCIVGILGNSVSTAGKEIASHFAKNNQMSAKYINYLDISETFRFSDKTVYFIDGWFGLWNDNPSEQREVEKALELIKEKIKDEDLDVKFVIGLRSDIKESYVKVFNAKGFARTPNENILLDTSSEKKETSIKKHLQKIKSNCDIADCPCKKNKVGKIMKINLIGTHLTLKLLELDHTLGPTMTDEQRGPLVAMKEHFKSLRSKDGNQFASILYIVLNGFYDEDHLKQDIAKNFNVKSMAPEILEKYTKKLPTLAPMWSSKLNGEETTETNNAYVFWHNFLYISAFHAVYEESDEKEKMLLYCNMDAVLQLVRPVEHGTCFTVEADLNSISTFYNNRIKGKEIERHVKDHPLMKYLREKNENM